MHVQDRLPIALFCGLLFYFSLIRAQPTDVQTIFSLDIFSLQKPCAQDCFTEGPGFVGGCFEDLVGNAIGCVPPGGACGLGSSALAPNSCYCRSDLQRAAESFLTACVKSACTVGDSSIDISSAGSIYEYYCTSLGYPVNVPATTTQENSQTTTTVISSSPHVTSSLDNGSGVSSGSTPTNVPLSTSTNQGSTTTSASTAATTGSGQGSSGTSDAFWNRTSGIGTIVGIIVASLLTIPTFIVAIIALKRRNRRKVLRQTERMNERGL